MSYRESNWRYQARARGKGKKKQTARRTWKQYLPSIIRSSRVATNKWDNMEYSFKRSFLIANNGHNFRVTSYEYPIDFTVTLASLPTYTDFTALFDKYMITGAVAKIHYFANVNDDASGAPVVTSKHDIPRIMIVNDQDDNTALSNVEAMMQYGGMKEYYMDKPHRHFFKPRALVQAYRTATTTAYVPSEAPMWIDMAQTDVPHYCGKGMVLCVNAGTGGDSVNFEIRMEVTFKCKNTH